MLPTQIFYLNSCYLGHRLGRDIKTMRLYDFIPTHMEKILQQWEEFARKIWPGDLTDVRILRDHAEKMLNAIAADLQTSQTDEQQFNKSIGKGFPSRESRSMDLSSTRHAISRVDWGFDLCALVSEYRALRASILYLWSQEPGLDPKAQIEDTTRFNEAVDQLLVESIVSYSEKVDHSRKMFLGILGHDLRSPLHAVSMVAGILEEHEELTGLAKKMASQIVVSARAMEKMITDLLDFTGASLGAKMSITRHPLDLGALGREVIEEVRMVHPLRTFHLEIHGDGHGQWDSARLRQLISNLLNNAVQHGSSTTAIALFVDGSGDDVVLGVRNHGTPIPQEALTLIFDPLRRNTSHERCRPAGSIGLGLYIAREIATAHEGVIKVSSTEDETVFSVRLPR